MRARARPLFLRTVFQILFRISQSNGKNENPKTDISALKSVLGFRVRLQIRNPDFKNLTPDFPTNAPEGLIENTCDSKSQTLRMRYPFQSTGRPIWHRNVWSFRVYTIPVQQPAWIYAGVTRAALTFCGGIMQTNVEPWEGTGVNSLPRESRV